MTRFTTKCITKCTQHSLYCDKPIKLLQICGVTKDNWLANVMCTDLMIVIFAKCH